MNFIFYTIIAVLYIWLQFDLNTSIVDSVSPKISQDTVDELISESRIVTSIGAFLIFFQAIILRRYSVLWIGYGGIVAVIAGFSFLLVPDFQKDIITNWVNTRSEEMQKQALIMAAATYGVTTERWIEPKIGLEGNYENRPDQRAAIAYVPALIMASGKLEELKKLTPLLIASALYNRRGVFRSKIENNLEIKCSEFNKFYERYNEAAPYRDQSGIRGRYVRKKVREESTKFFGYDPNIRIGLSRDELIKQAAVQARIREEIFQGASNVQLPSQLSHIVPLPLILEFLEDQMAYEIIDPCSGWESFDHEFYQPVFRVVETKATALIQDDVSLNDIFGERAEDIGRRAIYAVFAPPIGLTASLLLCVIAGAGFVGNLIFPLAKRLGFTTLLFSVPAACFLLVYPFTTTNAVLEHEGVKGQLNRVYEEVSPTALGVILLAEWSLRTAPIIYNFKAEQQRIFTER